MAWWAPKWMFRLPGNDVAIAIAYLIAKSLDDPFWAGKLFGKEPFIREPETVIASIFCKSLPKMTAQIVELMAVQIYVSPFCLSFLEQGEFLHVLLVFSSR